MWAILFFSRLRSLRQMGGWPWKVLRKYDKRKGFAMSRSLHQKFQIAVCLSSKNSQVFIWAFEAAGILAMLQEDLAKEVLKKAEEGLKSNDEEFKISAINVVTDLIAVYGHNEIVNWQGARDFEEEGTESNSPFVDFLLDIIRSKVC
ncbi:hypothetical protein TELCIR_08453 [Teladorsagia circumcincta]|uniref:Nuclear condensin complex subunit 3 C-terminal domain-containing protein n=1 Tax=Teladorsagia circumcincta TaxID=45464 RepID=A0A2G9UHJ6_TELCI|nr:hypothetical protein TELCIR_08453 [Teladorsagia circumcincta]